MEKIILNDTDISTLEKARLAIAEAGEINVTIETAQQFKELSFKMKDLFKTLDKIRLERTLPLRDEIKVVNDRFSKTLKTLDFKSKEIINAVFQFEREEQKKIAEKKRLELQEKIKAFQDNKPRPAALPVTTPESVELPNVKTIKRWTFTVTDIKDVPWEYLKIDEAKVNLAIKAGIVKISGLHISSEEKPVRR